MTPPQTSKPLCPWNSLGGLSSTPTPEAIVNPSADALPTTFLSRMDWVPWVFRGDVPFRGGLWGSGGAHPGRKSTPRAFRRGFTVEPSYVQADAVRPKGRKKGETAVGPETLDVGHGGRRAKEDEGLLVPSRRSGAFGEKTPGVALVLPFGDSTRHSQRAEPLHPTTQRIPPSLNDQTFSVENRPRPWASGG